MTPKELEEAEYIISLATPGPWRADFGQVEGPEDDVLNPSCPPSLEDALFIAAAREGWPKALAEVRRSWQENQRASCALLYLAKELSTKEKWSPAWIKEAFDKADEFLEREDSYGKD